MGTDDPGTTDSAGDIPLDAVPLHSVNLLTLLDAGGVIRYESPSIERVFGWEQDALVGETAADYFHPNDRAAVVEAFRSVVESDEYAVEAAEYRHRQADGSYTWVESVTSADPTPEGHYVVNTRDISARKARERELEATNERLETFVSTVSHDLRNPLQVAQARLELDREQRGGSEHLDSVADAHDRIASLIDDLLALSSTETDGDRTGVVELASLTETCWGLVPTADATIRVETDCRLRADRSRLAQLLENLMRNAVEHGSTGYRNAGRSDEAVQHGTTSPESQARQDDLDGGDGVTLTVGDLPDGFYVADDGPGIPEADREEVFDAGYSSDADGTGFGLHIVRRVVDAHEWDLALTESEAGGARFEITGVSILDA